MLLRAAAVLLLLSLLRSLLLLAARAAHRTMLQSPNCDVCLSRKQPSASSQWNVPLCVPICEALRLLPGAAMASVAAQRERAADAAAAAAPGSSWRRSAHMHYCLVGGCAWQGFESLLEASSCAVTCLAAATVLGTGQALAQRLPCAEANHFGSR